MTGYTPTAALTAVLLDIHDRTGVDLSLPQHWLGGRADYAAAVAACRALLDAVGVTDHPVTREEHHPMTVITRITRTREGCIRVPVNIAELREDIEVLLTARATATVVLVAGLAVFAAGAGTGSATIRSAGLLVTLLAAVRVHYLAQNRRHRLTYRYLRCRCPRDSGLDGEYAASLSRRVRSVERLLRPYLAGDEAIPARTVLAALDDDQPRDGAGG